MIKHEGVHEPALERHNVNGVDLGLISPHVGAGRAISLLLVSSWDERVTPYEDTHAE